MRDSESVREALQQQTAQHLFPATRELLPFLSDIYELELALAENVLLDDRELLANGAYFARVGGEPTRHFLMSTGTPLKLPSHASSRLKSFFEKNQFRTGYATHGLFPYRGKFHPQMVKGILNAMGLQAGDTVLDPMMGSGTVAVEASLMGINSVGFDASPFCRFMAATKLSALTMSIDRTRRALPRYQDVYQYFRKKVGLPARGTKLRKTGARGSCCLMEELGGYDAERDGSQASVEDAFIDTHNLLLLAYLDSAGYCERSTRKDPVTQFGAVMERYVAVVDKIRRVLDGMESVLGSASVHVGDARSLPLDDGSVDGVLFSPPYSFAIDYVENDSFHLDYLDVDQDDLRGNMIGLRGRALPEKYELYRQDMDLVVGECSRVLRRGGYCVIVIGTNDSQLSKALKLPREEVEGLHQVMTELAERHRLQAVRSIVRPITGMSNTMRREYILFLRAV